MPNLTQWSKPTGYGSLADFMSARYGRSQPLAVLTTVVALLGTIPYIALQLKAVGQTFNIMAGSPTGIEPEIFDTAFFAAIFLTIFAIFVWDKASRSAKRQPSRHDDRYSI